MTLWMPPMAWGNCTYYARYARLLLGGVSLDLSEAQRRRVVVLRPGASFSLYKYFKSGAGPSAATTGFKFVLLALGMARRVCLYGFADDARNGVDRTGGHYFDKRHQQEQSYDLQWERDTLQRLEQQGQLCMVPGRVQDTLIPGSQSPEREQRVSVAQTSDVLRCIDSSAGQSY